MTNTSIRVSDETRKKLNRYRSQYDITQGDAIQKLLDERGRIEYPYVTTCDSEGCDVKLAFDSDPYDYDRPHVYCTDCKQKLTPTDV